MGSHVYLDYNATTPLHPDLTSFVSENISKFGNPSSVHWAGREAKKLISTARDQISKYLNADPLEFVFTSGGSEGNNMALRGVLPLQPAGRREIICSTVEHPSVMKSMDSLRKQGYVIEWLPVRRDGSVDLARLDQMLSPKTALVSVQFVNNETGNIFPIKEISRKAHSVGAVVHSDMVQALGKVHIDLKDIDVDLATFAGHKFYSLKGAGFLFIRRGIKVEPLILGGGQERSRRAGTENALAIGCLGRAVHILGPRVAEANARLEIMRGKLEKQIIACYPEFQINGTGSPRVANTINLTCRNFDGETMLISLDTKGFAVSSGAACSSGSQEPSPVLRAMGFSNTEASQSLRITLGWLTEEPDLGAFLEAFQSAIKQIRESADFASEYGLESVL